MGIIISVPLGVIASVFGFASAGLTTVCKKLEPKILKNRDIVSLAIAKRERVNRLVSKALIDQKIDHSEFQLILDEMASFTALKTQIQNKLRRESKQSQLDLKKIKQEIRQQEREEMRKKSPL